MQVKTLLNFVEKHKGFVYESINWGSYDKKDCLEVRVRPRRGSKAVCSGCGKRRPGYDTLAEYCARARRGPVSRLREAG